MCVCMCVHACVCVCVCARVWVCACVRRVRVCARVCVWGGGCGGENWCQLFKGIIIFSVDPDFRCFIVTTHPFFSLSKLLTNSFCCGGQFHFVLLLLLSTSCRQLSKFGELMVTSGVKVDWQSTFSCCAMTKDHWRVSTGRKNSALTRSAQAAHGALPQLSRLARWVKKRIRKGTTSVDLYFTLNQCKEGFNGKWKLCIIKFLPFHWQRQKNWRLDQTKKEHSTTSPRFEPVFLQY